MSRGFITLHRKMTESAWYGKPEYVAVWIHLLMRANHKDRDVMVGNQVIKLKRGQFVSGRKALSKEIGLTENKLRTILSCFKNAQQINQQSSSKYSVFTVLNYDEYQSSNQQINQQTTSKPPANHQQTTTDNNVNNENNVKNRGGDKSSPPPASKKTQLKTYLKNCEQSDVDPIPGDSIVFKNADKLELPYEFVLVGWEHFKNHWLSKNACKADWVATFNNCLKADGYGAYQRNSQSEWYLTTKGKNTQILINSNSGANQ